MQISKSVSFLFSLLLLGVFSAKATELEAKTATHLSDVLDQPITEEMNQGSVNFLPQGIRRSRGYCQLVPPNTKDNSDRFYCLNSWGVAFHGHFISKEDICTDLLSASHLMESLDFCERELEYGECKIYPSLAVTRDNKYCANPGQWLLTFQDYPVDQFCTSLPEVFSKMDRMCQP